MTNQTPIICTLAPQWRIYKRCFISVQTKTCIKCSKIKYLDEFSKGAPGKRRNACKDCCNSAYREIYVRDPLYDKRNKLKRQYGITLEQYYLRIADQSNCCAICGINAETLKIRLCVDHDHTCCPKKKACDKCIRGLLCGNCNLALGKFKDSPVLLRKAAKYLEDNSNGR